MKTNGWEVYVRIKELSPNDGSAYPQIRIDTLAKEFGISKVAMKEYTDALAVLNFIAYTDASKEIFIMTDQE